MFIAFMGVPGCGKSATAAALANQLECDVFLEPEESEWSELVTARSSYGEFGPFLGLQWFRNTRVPDYLKAASIHAQGGTSVVDSMYDKLLAKYMSAASMSWLISPDNDYFDAAKKVAEIDYASLPDPTHLIFVSVDQGTWQKLLDGRGRDFDVESNISSYLAMQEDMFKSADAYCHDTDTQLILHNQRIGSAKETAQDVGLLLESLK